MKSAAGGTRTKGWPGLLVAAVGAAAAAGLAWGWTEPDRAAHAMVVTQDAAASRAGLQALRDGGNAVDAAVTAAFVLAVRHPRAGNIGGGGFLVYRPPSGDPVVYDFRETAPTASRPDMFLRDGAYDGTMNHEGGLSVGVPGSVAGLHMAWKERGRLAWKRVLAPAIAIARDGFPVSEWLSSNLKKEALPRMRAYPASMAVFTRAGTPLEAGDLLRQPDLARTLRLIAAKGPAGFYEGETAGRIEAEVKRLGGILTREDLAAYQPIRRSPLRGNYRGFEVLAPPPPGGGAVLVEALNLLEGFDLASPPPAGTGGAGSAATIHAIAETMRRAFADRARFLGDPAFQPGMPVQRLISKDYASRLRETIRMDEASASSPDILVEPPASPVQAGHPAATARFGSPTDSGAAARDPGEGTETTHLSVVDEAGGAVSLTTTIEQAYGSGIVVSGAGFLLNDEMGDFNPIPGTTTASGLVGTVPNLIAPGKRMLSSMSPAILVRDGKPFFVVGSPGGRSIISTVLLAIVNVVDFGMNAQEAVDAPRFHHQWLPDRISYETRGLSPDTILLLKAKGHTLFEVPYQGTAAAILREPATGVLQGAWDRRWPEGGAAGY